MPRAQNTHAYVNAGFRYEFAKNEEGQVDFQKLESVHLCFGGIAPDVSKYRKGSKDQYLTYSLPFFISFPQFVHAKQTEEFLQGKNPFDVAVLDSAYQILAEEIHPDSPMLDASPEYRKQLALGLFYKGILRIATDCGVNVDEKLKSGGTLLHRPLSAGQQSFTSDEKVPGRYTRSQREPNRYSCFRF